jgi:hypothetical protein
MASQQHGRLCELCTWCFYDQRKISYDKFSPHHTSYSDLERAAGSGCYFCVRVYRDVKNAAHLRNVPPVFTSMQYRLLRFKGLYFKVNMGDYKLRWYFRWFDQSRYPQMKCEDVPATTKDPSCMELAKGWLDNCRGHHNCQAERRLTTSSTNPTRVLYVERTSGGLLKARLHYPSMTKVLDYLTLSHVWGTRKFVVLTKENHDAFLKGIVITDLSKNFQDALHVTTELGFSFLWIDSLCIIQDDPEDWVTESKHMAQIYKNAVCNICAAVSTSATTGFLPEQRVLPSRLPMVRLGKVGPIGSQLASDWEPWGNLREAELYQRAWVLQEQVLVSIVGTYVSRR